MTFFPFFKKYTLLAILVAASCTVLAQSPQEQYKKSPVEKHGFDHKKWESLKEGIDYTGLQKKPVKKEQKMDSRGQEKGNDVYVEEREPRAGAAPADTSQGEGFGKTFTYVLLGIGIALLVFLILKLLNENVLGTKNRKLKSAAAVLNLQKIEENLPEAELDDPIQQAIKAGDFALALRLQYLAILKELALKKRIRWKRDKTNGEYLLELSGGPFFAPVQEVTLIFERVWYGKKALGREDYFSLEPKFKGALAGARK